MMAVLITAELVTLARVGNAGQGPRPRGLVPPPPQQVFLVKNIPPAPHWQQHPPPNSTLGKGREGLVLECHPSLWKTNIYQIHDGSSGTFPASHRPTHPHGLCHRRGTQRVIKRISLIQCLVQRVLLSPLCA